MRIAGILITVILIKDVTANKFNNKQCDPLIDRQCMPMSHSSNECDLINDPNCAMKIIEESDAYDKDYHTRPCGPFDRRRKCNRPMLYPHYPHAFLIGNPNVKHPDVMHIPQKNLDDLITEQLSSKDPFTQYLQDLDKPNNNNLNQNYYDYKKPYRPENHRPESQRPSAHYQQESNSAEWSHPLSHKQESNRPETHSSMSQRPEIHRPEFHRPESHHPESQRPDSHRPESHRPGSNRPESHRPMYYRPDSSESEYYSKADSSEWNYQESHRPVVSHKPDKPHAEAYYQANKRPSFYRPESYNKHPDNYRPQYKPTSHYESQDSSELSSEEEHSWKPYFPQNYYSTPHYSMFYHNKNQPNYPHQANSYPLEHNHYKPTKHGYYHQEPHYQASFTGSHVTQQFGNGYFEQKPKSQWNKPHIATKLQHQQHYQRSSEEYAMDLFNRDNLNTMQIPDSLLESTELNIRDLKLGSFVV